MVYKPVNPTASPIIRRPVGRPRAYPGLGRPMTVKERKERSRWMQSFLARLKKPTDPLYGNWYGAAPVDIVAHELAHAHFDTVKNEPNLSRWKEMDAYVRHYFKELQEQFS